MKEIKFRAWDSVRKKMFSASEMGADELQLNPDGRGFFNASSGSPKLSQYFPHMIPLQFIGLHDKNGKEIYEGDIVPTMWGNTVITWADDFAGFYAKRGGTDIALTEFTPEVIGNIYENHELLGVKP